MQDASRSSRKGEGPQSGEIVAAPPCDYRTGGTGRLHNLLILDKFCFQFQTTGLNGHK